MRLLPLAVLLLAWSALADDTQSAAQTRDYIVVELPSQGFRLSGSFDLGTVSARGDDFAMLHNGIPSNGVSSELRSWRLPETFGYYPPGSDATGASSRRSRF